MNKNAPLKHTETLDRDPAQISMRGEIKRKLIHLSSFGVPLLYYLLGREVMLAMLIPATLISITVEILRVRSKSVDRFVRKLFGEMLRAHEANQGRIMFSGATWVLLSATICVLIFPQVITITGFTVLIVSDTSAALFGRRFGRHKFLEKSVEGTSAFFITAMGVVVASALLFEQPWQFIAVGAVASLVATIAEALSHGGTIDDNLTIPMSFGLVMWGGLAIVGGGWH